MTPPKNPKITSKTNEKMERIATKHLSREMLVQHPRIETMIASTPQMRVPVCTYESK